MDGVSLSICVCTGGSIKTDTVASLYNAILALKCPIHISFLKGGYSYQNRNIGVFQAQQAGATHIIMIDADMTFDPYSIQKLIECDKDIIGADYNEKKFPLTPTIKRFDENDELILVPHEDLPKEVFEVDRLPGGFTLIKMSVFKKLKRPYFQAPSGKTYEDFTTEDYWFSKLAKKAGFSLWCDPSLRVGHVGEHIY